ncbi:MAG: tetratricopeptide repeat protein, partial [Acetobacter sp.]|nr:tetratricopeptide repeat protein [Acetobacter sp.]
MDISVIKKSNDDCDVMEGGLSSIKVGEKEVCSVEVFESNFLEYLKKGETKEGLRYALKTVVEYPDDIALHICIARLLGSHLSLHEISAMIFQDVLKRDPNNIQIEVELAGALIAEGDVVSGCAKFADMMTRYPQYRTELCEWISKNLIEKGYFQEALDILLQWDQQNTTSWIMNNTASALQALNRSSEAVSWYDKCLEREPHHLEVIFSRSLALLKSGCLKEGFSHYVKRDCVYKLDPFLKTLPDEKLWFLSLPRLGRDDISGKRVVLYQEQGFGDSINFIRFV